MYDSSKGQPHNLLPTYHNQEIHTVNKYLAISYNIHPLSSPEMQGCWYGKHRSSWTNKKNSLLIIYNCNMQTIAWCIWRGDVSRYLSLEFTYWDPCPLKITWPHDGIQSCSPEMQWLLIKVISPSFRLKNLVNCLNCTLPLVGIIQKVVPKMHSGLIWF